MCLPPLLTVQTGELLIEQPDDAITIYGDRRIGRARECEQVGLRPGHSAIVRASDMYCEPGGLLVGAKCQVHGTAVTGSGIDGNRKRTPHSLLTVVWQTRLVEGELHSCRN